MRTFALLLLFSTSTIASEPIDKENTWGEIYEVARANGTLSARQHSYLWSALQAANSANEISWELHDHGLFCPVGRTIYQPEDLLPIIVDETHSDRGWGYPSDALAAAPVVRALAIKFKCTPEAEAEIRREHCKPWSNGIVSALCKSAP